MAWGPAVGPELVAAVAAEPRPRGHHLLPSVRSGRLEKLGRPEEARTEYRRAAQLTHNRRERDLLRQRAGRGQRDGAIAAAGTSSA